MNNNRAFVLKKRAESKMGDTWCISYFFYNVTVELSQILK